MGGAKGLLLINKKWPDQPSAATCLTFMHMNNITIQNNNIVMLALHQGRSKSTVVRDIYGHLSISLVRSVARSIMGREIVH